MFGRQGLFAAGTNLRVAAHVGDAPDAVRVAVPDGMAPVRVRYAWDHYPDCNLRTAAGLPVGPFELPVDSE